MVVSRKIPGISIRGPPLFPRARTGTLGSGSGRLLGIAFPRPSRAHGLREITSVAIRGTSFYRTGEDLVSDSLIDLDHTRSDRDYDEMLVTSSPRRRHEQHIIHEIRSGAGISSGTPRPRLV